MALSLTTGFTGINLPELLLKTMRVGNDLMESGVVRVVPGIAGKLYLPRVEMTGGIVAYDPQPLTQTSGTTTITEASKELERFSIIQTMDANVARKFWADLKTDGNYVNPEWAADVATSLIEEYVSYAGTEISRQMIVGDPVTNPTTEFITGICTQLAAGGSGALRPASQVALTSDNINDKIQAGYDLIPDGVWKKGRGRLKLLVNKVTYELIRTADITEFTGKGETYFKQSPLDLSFGTWKDLIIEVLPQIPNNTYIIGLFDPADRFTNLYAGIDYAPLTDPSRNITGTDLEVFRFEPVANSTLWMFWMVPYVGLTFRNTAEIVFYQYV